MQNTATRLLAKILRRLSLDRWIDFEVPIYCQAGKLRIPLQRGLTECLLTAVDGGFKADLVKLLDAHGLFSGLVCDVGVNTGQTLLELFGQGISVKRYYGFEPNPTALAIVERLVGLNSLFGGVALMPWACSSVDTPLRFFAIVETDSGATLNPSIRPDWYDNMEGAFAASYRLDTVASLMELCRHFFLKIDVEGGELEVLQGAEKILAQWRPIIQCEVLHAHRDSELAANNQHKTDLAALLARFGYLIYQCRLSVPGARLEDLLPLDYFPSSIYQKSPHTCDYLFLPRELRTRLFP